MSKRCRKLGAVLAMFAMLFITTGADHREAPNLFGDPLADILDVYAFVNPNNGNVVLAMTVDPFVVAGTTQAFAPDVLYQFKIDNTGDASEDLTFQMTFSKANRSADIPAAQQQTFTLVGPVAAKKATTQDKLATDKEGSLTVTGPADGTVTTGSNGIKVFTGLRDDPFFIDFIYVLRLLGVQAGGPLTRNPGIDFFAGMNCLAIAIEVPPAMLKGTNGNTIKVWATTSRANSTKRSSKSDDNGGKPAKQYVQVDRTGLPVISTVLVRANSNARKDEFNRISPSQDRDLFRADVLAELVKINNDQAYSNTLVDVLLPDVLTLDMTSTAGFLNGRRPQDDVIDTVLSVASNGAVTTDAVNANDVPFLTDFPFLAPPHQPTEAIPARN